MNHFQGLKFWSKGPTLLNRGVAVIKMVLIRVYPQDHGRFEDFHVDARRQAVRPGHKFDGREGRIGDVRTGWYEPAGWVTVEECALLLHANGGCYGRSQPTLEECRLYAKELAAEPGDFPGLLDSYDVGRLVLRPVMCRSCKVPVGGVSVNSTIHAYAACHGCRQKGW